MLVLLAGCPSTAPAPPTTLSDAGMTMPEDDGGRPPDAGGPVDSDLDGLCDSTERANGTDPNDPDTDADGFLDFVEDTSNYDPLVASDPDPAAVVFLEEEPGRVVSVVPTVDVDGEGFDYAGAVEALEAPGDLAGLDASAFFIRTQAIAAQPARNAAAIEREEGRFLGVVGETKLAFEVQLGFGQDSISRPCARAYPFRYTVKRSDGVRASVLRFLLVVLPRGQTLRSADWCLPDGECR